MNYEIITSTKYRMLEWNTFEARHNINAQMEYGVWRWKGMCENKDIILDELSKVKTIIDYGGALAPLGFESMIVDHLTEDILGNKVIYKNLSGFHNETIDIIFSSHFLEHIKDIKGMVHIWNKKLVSGGKLILHVPSIKGVEFWHPDVKAEHNWIFCLNIDIIEDIKVTLPIDVLIKQFGFNLQLCKYVGDNSILLIGVKNAI